MQKTRELFSTPIWIIDDVYNDPEKVSKAVILLVESKNITPPQWECNTLSTFSFDNHLEAIPFFEKLLDDIKVHVDKYTRNYWNIDSQILSCWANVAKSNHFQEQHHHLGLTPTIVSAVYYSQAPENEKINFHSPFTAISVFGKWMEKIDVKANRLIIFPSYLEHSFRPIQRPVDKISIAINYKLKQ